MTFLPSIALLLGFCATIALILASGPHAIFQLLSQAKWWLPWLIPLRALSLLLDVAGWRALFIRPCGLLRLFWIATVREGINRLLPVANIGGEVVGVHLLIRQGVAVPEAAASVVVETLLGLGSQFIFAAIGLVCLVQLAGLAPLPSAIFLSLGLSLAVIFAFVILLKHGSAFHRVERAATSLLTALRREGPRFSGRSLDAAIEYLLAAPQRLLTASLWQIVGLLVGCTETWLVLRWLGHPVSAAAAIALESLSQVARSIFFIIPSGLGIQEAGLIGLGRLIGVDAEVAISLSLAKRLRELIFGLPALGAWQWLTRIRSGLKA
ncbi:MAG TPA: flippase-like domain-containing protein [Steroidobacteraceae bacterium]|nr:flippase-like domain-containing protein [Steroidobacteraceae bacterium]